MPLYVAPQSDIRIPWKSPVFLQDIGVQVLVLGGVLTVDQVIGIHHGADMPFLHGGFKGRQVDFPQGALIDDCVNVPAVVFGVVGGVMLHGGHHILTLNAENVLRCDLPGKIGIFAEVFEIVAIHRRAINVDSGT